MRDTPKPVVPPPGLATLSTVSVCIADGSETLGPRTDESYSLTVPADVTGARPARVSAGSVFGAMHALETMTQLVDPTFARGSPASRVIPAAPVTVTDAPKYPYRGVMIDSGRHFLPVALVKRVVDGVSMLKMNAIHWHLVDSTSFATCSQTFPSLCELGGYPNAGTGGAVNGSKVNSTYSKTDMEEIVTYANRRGVRIQPEWDMPGHGAFWHGRPDLVTSACKDVFDVTKPELYTFLREFLGEMTSIFTDEYLFLGGDEVDTGCELASRHTISR
jgi:hexosaminidase